MYASLGNWNVFFATTILWTGAFAVECPRACKCTEFIELGILCPKNNSEVYVTYNTSYRKYKKIQIMCIIPKSNSEAINYCSINTILNKILLNIDNENVRELVFRSVSKNRKNIVISKDSFKSVQNLNMLSISYNNIVNFESDFLGNTQNITQLALISSGVSKLDNYFTFVSKLEILALSENKISSLPNKVFENLSLLTYLHLDGNNISNFSKYAFSGLRMLRVLDLSRNQIRELTKDIFEELKALEYIYLTNNRLKNIHGHFFDKNPSLVIVELGNNSDLVLQDYLLANLTSLTTVDLALNNLEEIPKNIFRNSGSLNHLSLSKNRLVSLSETLFSDLYALKILDLSENKLKTLPNTLFVSTPMLLKLNLSNNQLSVINNYLFRKLDNLYEIDLHSNKINLIEIQAFGSQNQSLTYLDLSHNEWNANSSLNYCRSLQQLSLSHNRIRVFPYMNALKSLKKMDLSYNQIEYFEVKYVIEALWSPTEYDLSNNRIRNITFCLDKPIGLKKFGTKKIVINVTKNPIQCDCSIYDLVRYNNGEMEDLLEILDIHQDNLICSGRHNNTLIKSLRPSDFECSALQGCPSKCECWSTPCNRALVVDCAFRNLTTYPEIYVEEPIHQHIILNLSGNLLIRGPFEQDSYSKVISLNLSSNRISGIDWIPPHTKELDLSNNSLENLNKAFIKKLKNSINLQWLGLRNNAWTCDCSASDFREYLIEKYYMVKLDEVYCKNMDSALVKISDLCKEVPYFTVLLPVFLTIFLCLAVTLALYYRYQTEIKVYLFAKNMCLWFVTEEEMDKGKIFDVFISYSHQDEDFVVEQLLPQLEQGETPFKACIHIRDWIPGELIAHQIIWSVQNSRRTLIVLSNSFLESVWGKMEFRAAHTEALTEGRARVIVLLYGDIDENKVDDELNSYLKTNTYIKWGEKYFWNKLKYALPHFKKNAILREESVDRHSSMVLNVN